MKKLKHVLFQELISSCFNLDYFTNQALYVCGNPVQLQIMKYELESRVYKNYREYHLYIPRVMILCSVAAIVF
jgi:hypothetical protein